MHTLLSRYAVQVGSHRDGRFGWARYPLITAALVLTPLIHSKFFFLGEYLRTMAAMDTSAHTPIFDTVARLTTTIYAGWGAAALLLLAGWLTFLVGVALGKTSQHKLLNSLRPTAGTQFAQRRWHGVGGGSSIPAQC